jgi:3-oxoacyl-[acyl-carrier-protein] synthase-3
LKATSRSNFLKNFVNIGESFDKIRSGEKNIGSIALSSFIFQQASKPNPNPIDLLGAMFIIEGVGKRLSGYGEELKKDQRKEKGVSIKKETN